MGASGVRAEAVSLEALMTAFLAGEQRAFEQLYRHLAPSIEGYLRGLCRDPRLAEDLTQTTFLKVLRHRDTWLRDAPVRPWVFAIARRAWLDHRRHKGRRKEDLSPSGEIPEERVPEAGVEFSDRLEPEQWEALRTGLEALPEAQREALLLLKVRDLSVREAAAIAGVTPSALKVRAHRAYEALRGLLGLKGSKTP